jgi:integrase
MLLKDLIEQYIVYRKCLGEKCRTNGTYLRAFSKFMGKTTLITSVTAEQVKKFLYGNGPVTSAWHIKYAALSGFYCYAISREYVKASPLPTDLPKRPPHFVPYIYTREELKKVFETAFTYQKNKSCMEPYLIYVFLVLLYGAGLRLSEAIALKVKDVDLTDNVIIIRQTKFYKSRLIPIGKQLSQLLKKYRKWQAEKGYSITEEASFFINNNGVVVNPYTMSNIYRRIRNRANIRRTDGSRYQPRLHDFRHTFAVHRLTTWYQNGADVQQLLPILSVYMGHTCLAATSVYLTMTKELLNEANIRFEKYAMGASL